VNKLFSFLSPKIASKKPVIIVSGLPRSGTSLMMKMIYSGGIPVITDGLRSADDDNPNGYFELEAVKELSEGNSAWLEDAGGKAVKVVSSLLEFLPPAYSYKIIFLERELGEVLKSQQKMLVNRNESNRVNDQQMQTEFQTHLIAVRAWLARQANMDVLYIDFNALLANPQSFVNLIAEFIGIPLNTERMLAVPDNSLYRNRAEH
jgi:LPS sulfotransferase NodH